MAVGFLRFFNNIKLYNAQKVASKYRGGGMYCVWF